MNVQIRPKTAVKFDRFLKERLEAWTDQILVANRWQEMFEGNISA